MPVEKSAGAIIFRRKGKKIYYLLLHYPSNINAKKDYWDLPKGHIEKREKEIETARREVFEETGLKNILFKEGYEKTIKYFFRSRGQTIFKTVVFYLGETKTETVHISSEHIGFKWLPYKEAYEELTFENARKVLRAAYDFVSKKGL